MYKRLFAAMTALCLMLTLMPVSALAAEEELMDTFAEFEAAVDAAEDGGTVTLDSDINFGDNYIVVKKQLTIDLGDYTIESANDSGYATITVGTAGDLTITAGEGGITNTLGDAVGNFGMLTIEGGEYTGYYALYNYDNAESPVATIENATFNAVDPEEDDVAIANCADLTLTDCIVNDALDSSAKLTVNGGEIAILRITEPDYDPECGTSTEIDDDVDIAEYENAAKIDTKFFMSLEEAVEAAETNDVITVLENINVTEALTISEDIEINGNDVTITSAVVDLFKVTAGGTLTLGEGITINATNSVLWANGGDIIIDGAEIDVANSPNSAAFVDAGSIEVMSGSITQSVENHPTLSVSASGTATISGGAVISENSSAILAKNGGEVIIDGGVVETTCADPTFCAAYARVGSSITLESGEITAFAGKGLVSTGGTVTVNGGTVNGGVVAHENASAEAAITDGIINGDVYAANGATLTISGGTFEIKPADEYIVEGKIAAQEGEVYIVREYVASELTTDIGEIEFVIGVPTEFTFTTTANDDKDTMVIGTSNFSDAEAIEKLEYYEVQNDTWIELTGDFGPAAGFPMADATSKFRVTFKTAGDYSFTASMKHAETEAIVCSTVVEFTVTDLSAETPSASAPVTESYDVAIADSANGSVAANTMRAGETSRVTLTVKADAGYVLESLTVTDKNGKEIKVTEKDGKYQFRMPASDVTVKAVFAAAEADIEDETFTDVAEDAYYHDAVLWAVENGITNGMTESTFAPNATCTRAQMVTFLWRAAGCPVPQNAAHSFTDLDKDAYYYNAVLWAVEKGITNGVSLDAFDPNGTVTRGQAMTFLWRMDGKTAADADHTFTDVEDGAYYEDAVAWGADEAITNGTSATTFSPDDACIRGQIVTFLYNYLVK